MDTFKRHRLLRFLASGATAAAVEYGIFLILQHLSLHIVILQTVSFMFGLFVSFALNRVWVFSAKGRPAPMFTKYALLAGVNLLIGNLLITGMAIYVSPPLAKIMVMALIASWNFLIFQKIIFR